MARKFPFWTGIIGIIFTTLNVMPTVIAKTSAEMSKKNEVVTLVASTPDHRGRQFVPTAQSTPLKIRKYIESALAKVRRKDYQGALADYNNAIRLEPNYADSYVGRGGVRVFISQDYQGALVDFNRAIQLEPNALAYNNRGNLKRYAQDYQGALADFNRAIQLEPNLASPYRNRAFLKYDFLRDRFGAISDLKQAIKLEQQQGAQADAENLQRKLQEWQAAVR